MRTSALPVAVTAVLLIAGCTDSDTGGGRDEQSTAQVTTSAPDGELTLVADADPAASSVSASRALFDTAGVAVVARDGDAAGTLLGASAAVGLGVPLLMVPDAGPADVPAAELDRLHATTVLTVGDVDGKGLARESKGGGDARTVVAVPADHDAVERVTGLEFATADPVATEGTAAAVAGLDPEKPVGLAPEDDAPQRSPEKYEDPDPLPRVERAEALGGTMILASGSPESLAGIATARAAGAAVRVTDGSTDPRSSADVVTALSEDRPEHVVALGAGFAAEDGLDWKLATAAGGAQLPGGGQTLFPGRMFVALYGSPGTAALGLLGEQDLDGSIRRAQEQAAQYEGLVDATVVPTFEVIVTVASTEAGPDNNYSTELDVETLRPWVEAAGQAGVYVVLDLQPGRTDFRTQAEAYRSLIELPHVGLALDPEWRLGAGQVHLTQVGSVAVDEINQVITWLADLTRENNLPQKLLVVHQFRVDMIDGREQLETSRDEVAVMVHADGQGGQGDKQATWGALHVDPPAEPLYWGWKNFIDEDQPMLTPEQTVAQVQPLPDLISYQ